MQGRRQPRRFLVYPWRRRKKRPTAILTLDAVRTTLELVESSADICTPLKSAVGAVVAVCKLTDRIAATATDAEALAWRAYEILEGMYNAVGAASIEKIPPNLVDSILQFEQLLNEIRVEMEDIKAENRIRRLVRLRRNESQLSNFTARLDSAAEAFNIGLITSHTLSLGHIEDGVRQVSFRLERSDEKLDFLQHTLYIVVFLA